MYMGCCYSEFHALCDRQTTGPSSPSSTILRSAYMALNTLQQDWLL